MDDKEFKLDFDFEKEYGFNPDDFLTPDDGFDYSEFLEDDIDSPEAADDTHVFGQPIQEQEAADSDEPAPEEAAAAEGDEPAEELPAEKPAVQEDVAPSEDQDEPKPRKKPGKPGKKLPKPNMKMPSVNLVDMKEKLGIGKKKDPALPEADAEEPTSSRRDRGAKKKGKLSHLVEIYLEPITQASAEADVMDPLDPKYVRKKKQMRQRIIKEVYLPAIIACVALFLIISFIVGSVSNALVVRQNRQQQEQQQAAANATQADKDEAAFKALIAQAESLAVTYDYDKAIALLDSYTGTNPTFVAQRDNKRSALAIEQNALVEWKDTSTIPNLSFHVLMADASRACNKDISGDLAGSYNKNFVSVEEFSRILNQLYAANYVLVDFNSFVSESKGMDGSTSYFPQSMYLPAGKKPIMITETMVNYFEYMVDTDKDGNPDSSGHGFANKLVVDSQGNIQAAYVDGSGQSHVGAYDLVPVLEAFIQEHPDFSYRGARATLAVTGTEGVFGYRTNTSYVASRGQSYYDDQVAQAKVVVEALREKGYTIASYTYSNQAYKSMTTIQIQAEMTNWTNQITPVLGTVDTIVFARGSDIEAYSGTTFNVLYNTGFRYFLNSGSSPRVDINTTFVRQTRLMVTGEAMAWYSSQFADYFDCNIVLDLSARGTTPAKS